MRANYLAVFKHNKFKNILKSQVKFHNITAFFLC